MLKLCSYVLDDLDATASEIYFAFRGPVSANEKEIHFLCCLAPTRGRQAVARKGRS